MVFKTTVWPCCDIPLCLSCHPWLGYTFTCHFSHGGSVQLCTETKGWAQPAVTALSTFCSLCFFYFQLAFSSWSRAGRYFLTPPCHSTCPPPHTLDRYTHLFPNFYPLLAPASLSFLFSPLSSCFNLFFLARLFTVLPPFTYLHLVRQICFYIWKTEGNTCRHFSSM